MESPIALPGGDGQASSPSLKHSTEQGRETTNLQASVVAWLKVSLEAGVQSDRQCTG